jgi:hypothetical protein
MMSGAVAKGYGDDDAEEEDMMFCDRQKRARMRMHGVLRMGGSNVV